MCPLSCALDICVARFRINVADRSNCGNGEAAEVPPYLETASPPSLLKKAYDVESPCIVIKV